MSLPERAAPGRRFLAAVVDAAAGLALGLLLSGNLGVLFARRAVVTFRIGSEGTVWTGPVPMVLGILGTLVYALPFTMLLVLLPEAFFGASLGKLLLGLRIRGDRGLPAASPALRRRLAVKSAGLWGMTGALLAGSWEAAVLAAAAGAAAILGFVPALRPPGKALHDLLSRTAVYRAEGLPRPPVR